jgi:hypothetical protein
MAFTATILARDTIATKEVLIGKYVNVSSTGGTIQTGLHHVDSVRLQPWGATANGHISPVNVSMPLAGGAVIIVTANNESGSFKIIGN